MRGLGFQEHHVSYNSGFKLCFGHVRILQSVCGKLILLKRAIKVKANKVLFNTVQSSAV